MNKPKYWEALREELTTVLPESSNTASLRDLEALPYLVRLPLLNPQACPSLLTTSSKRAIIKESLRFSMGTSGRLARLVPRGGTVLCNEPIAADTRVSFSHYVYNNDPSIFEDPFNFNPDRWLGPDVTKLDSHMISFSRGGRTCIGMNLAYAELYLTFAHLVRRFDVVNDGTTDEDMDWTDCFVPRFKGGLKVKLHAV